MSTLSIVVVVGAAAFLVGWFIGYTSGIELGVRMRTNDLRKFFAWMSWQDRQHFTQLAREFDSRHSTNSISE